MTGKTQKREIPTTVKAVVAMLLGAGGVGGLSSIPVNFNAQTGYEAVQRAYPDQVIQVRSWRPYIYKVISKDGTVTIVETSILDGKISDRW